MRILSSDRRRYYKVNVQNGERSCDCMDFIIRRKKLGTNCKHIDLALKLTRMASIQEESPAA